MAWLKWLRFPRTVCPVMITLSTRLVSATTVPAHQPTRRPRGRSASIQARERQYATNETANLNGLAQIGTPTRTRSSTASLTADMTAIPAIATENSTSGRCQDRHGAGPRRPPLRKHHRRGNLAPHRPHHGGPARRR